MTREEEFRYLVLNEAMRYISPEGMPIQVYWNRVDDLASRMIEFVKTEKNKTVDD